MKYISSFPLMLILISLVCIQFTTVTSAESQARKKRLFSVVDYMKVKPENINSYLELEQKIWKPMQEERLRLGIIRGWFLYAINFTGTNNEYNYVTIIVYDNMEGLENPWSASIPATVHPDKKVVDILKSANRLRSRVRTEMYESIARAPETPSGQPSPYVQVNYMRVPQGRSDEYERIEKEIWQPIHSEMVRRGNISGWGLWSLVYPSGDDLPYQYLTLDGVPRFGSLFEINSSEVFKDVHPTMTDEEISERTNQNRATARTELWELIDYAVH